jgi:serine/threonine protein kinase
VIGKKSDQNQEQKERERDRAIRARDRYVMAGGCSHDLPPIPSLPITTPPCADVDEKYQLGDVIGRGPFGVVRLAVDKASGKEWAIKFIDSKKIALSQSPTMTADLRSVCELLHPRLLPLLQVYQTPDVLAIVEPLAYGGDLLERIMVGGARGLSELVTMNIFGQIMAALVYMHSKGLAHGNIRAENILFVKASDSSNTVSNNSNNGSNNGNDIWLGDAVITAVVNPSTYITAFNHLPSYIAPEVLMASDNNRVMTIEERQASDMWSAGLVLYLMYAPIDYFTLMRTRLHLMIHSLSMI